MLDMTQYTIGVDVWEGDEDPDWGLLKDNRCDFAILRMNRSKGQLELDLQFHNWAAAKASGLACGVYVVINPYISRAAYVTWILANLPADCEVVCLDVEISGSTPSAYSALVTGILTDLQAHGLKVLLYSGYWFFTMLSPWPKAFDQWWARYPYVIYPPENEMITWAQLREKLAALDSFSPLGTYTIQPGHVAIWQCTSRYILPGGPADWPIDINLMPRVDFERIFGIISPTIEARLADLERRIENIEGFLNL